MSASPFFRQEVGARYSKHSIRHETNAATPERTAVRDCPETESVPETDNRKTGSAWLSWFVSDGKIRSVRSFG